MNDDDLYAKPVKGGLWAVSRLLEREWVHLIQERPVYCSSHAEIVLRALGLNPTEEMLDHCFHKNLQGQRCPTFAVMIEFLKLDPTHPLALKKQAVGV